LKDGKPHIKSQLAAFKRKYYANLMVKGLLIGVATLLSLWLVLVLIEFIFHLGSSGRGILFFGFLVTALFLLAKWIAWPWIQAFNAQYRLSDEEAARAIGNKIPDVSDRLLNYVQLSRVARSDSLAAASLQQKDQIFQPIRFTDAISFSVNKRYLRIALLVLLIFLTILLAFPTFVAEPSMRLTQFNKTFVPKAPFTISIRNEKLLAFKNEPFELAAEISGESIPNEVYLDLGYRKVKMQRTDNQIYKYSFSNLLEPITFRFEAAGFLTSEYEINVASRPNLKHFSTLLTFPSYTDRKTERLENPGNLLVPEGTQIEWSFETESAERLKVILGDDTLSVDRLADQSYQAKHRVRVSGTYDILLENKYSGNKDRIHYQIQMIPDKPPQINAEIYSDTLLYDFIVAGGNIKDDYGFTRFSLNYAITKPGEKINTFRQIPLAFERGKSFQPYYIQWNIDTLTLDPGDELRYYFQVWDNDRVNGPKSTRSALMYFRIPTKKSIEEQLDSKSQSSENQADKSLKESEELLRKLEENQNRLRIKKDLDWKDERSLKSLLEMKKSLEEEIQKLEKTFDELSEQQDRFQEQSNELEQKRERLQSLMEELNDPETQKLWEELEKLLEENPELDDINKQLDKLNRKEKNLKNDLERTLELMKRLQLEQELEKAIDELDEVMEDQIELEEETLSDSQEDQSLAIQQQDLKKEFEDLMEKLDKIAEKNQSLEHPETIPDNQPLEEEIKNEMEKSASELQKNKRKSAAKSQQNATQKMEQLSQDLQQLQSNMEQKQISENINNLRHIVDNLLKLSFAQETLMNDLKQVNQNDPRFINLSQGQLKLKDDAKVIEDSLIALSKRVFFLESFITEEVSDLNNYMDETIEVLRERQSNVVGVATAKQQFAMTSMNNLALMLDDALEQMQNMAASMMGNSQPNQQGDMPNLGEMQKQLNQQMQQLSNGQKSGRQLSEELAKLAAEQERIRRMLSEMKKMMESPGNETGSEGGNGEMDKIIEEMEETELDLVNKRLDRQTILRQEDILTRLLEAENAMREQELDEKREAESANQYQKKVPREFEEYIKSKQQEIELLRTVPVNLNPYYKEQATDYFERLNNSNP